MNVYQVIKHAV